MEFQQSSTGRVIKAEEEGKRISKLSINKTIASHNLCAAIEANYQGIDATHRLLINQNQKGCVFSQWATESNSE